MIVKHYVFEPDGTKTVVEKEVNDDYFLNQKPVYTDLELAQQSITDLELDNIELGQSMTDLELMIMEGYHV